MLVGCVCGCCCLNELHLEISHLVCVSLFSPLNTARSFEFVHVSVQTTLNWRKLEALSTKLGASFLFM